MFFLQFFQNPIGIVIFIILLVITVTVHEWAHAKMADHLGDPTPDLAGRVTLDPRAHLDPLGSLLFLLTGFGWGKPVPFDPYNLKDPQKETALIAFVGPLSNAVMALGGAGILFLLTYTSPTVATDVVRGVLILFVELNVRLGIFNLLPFAPLDGFKVVGGLLSRNQAAEWYSLERYGIYFLFFFILPFFGNKSMLEILVLPIINMITGVLIG